MSENHLTIQRMFNAPVQLLWDVHTDPHHLVRWFGPKGFKMEIASYEAKPGGILHYSITNPQGQGMFGLIKYLELAAPTRMVYVNSFADEDQNIVRHPMSDTWPLEVHNEMNFESKGDQTLLTIRSRPINASDQEMATYMEASKNVEAGMAGMFEQLDDYLSTIQ